MALSCWKRTNPNARSFMTADPLRCPVEESGYKLSPQWFSYLPDRPFGVTSNNGLPQILDPIVANWIKLDVSNIDSQPYKEIPDLHRSYYLTQCLMLLFSTKQTKPSSARSAMLLDNSNFSSRFKQNREQTCLLTPLDVIKKLDLFGSSFMGWYSNEESEMILRKCIDTSMAFLACELVYRGLTVSIKSCLEWDELGALLYSIQESRVLGVVIDRPFESDSVPLDTNTTSLEENESNYYTLDSILQDSDNPQTSLLDQSPVILDSIGTMFPDISQSPIILDAPESTQESSTTILEEDPLCLQDLEIEDHDLDEELKMFGISLEEEVSYDIF